MTRYIFLITLAMLRLITGKGQDLIALYPFNDQSNDTITLREQPQWKTGMPIFNYCSFYEETGDRAMNFDDVRNQSFIPYSDSLRQSRSDNRPLVIQWLRFTISNPSSDTIRLRINPGAHYFLALYDEAGFIAKSGIFETTVKGYEKGCLPLMLLPGTTKTVWTRIEDRRSAMTPAWISLETPFTFYKNSTEGALRDRLLLLLLSLLTGSLFFISAFALWQYYLYRDQAFFWYVAYTLCAGFTGLFWIDIRHQVGIFSSLLHDLIFSVFLFIVPVLYSVFIGKMLKLSEHFPRLWKVSQLLMLVSVIQALIEYTTTRTGTFILTNYYGYFISMVPVSILNLLLIILTALSKERIKWFLFAGLVSLLILWCMPMLIALNVEFRLNAVSMVLVFIPFYFLTGLTIEAICFSFAISYRSKLVWLEMNDLQLHYSQELKEALDKRTDQLEIQNKIVEEQRLKQIQTTFEKRLAETEMAALRAQMNPHFIFNCLNSIKLYTLENDSKSASEYLTLFSQLIRVVLENSRAEKVTLQKELETIRLYIALEAMRFKNKVSYQIDVSPDIDQQYTELPPLLIQPYVENAIWHGLMHKKEGGHITISITQNDEHFLQVEITDNGVGREQAAIYKSKSAVSQKSFGLKVTSERIEVLNQIYGIHADVEIDDMKDQMDHACGTKVVIRIPVD